jgi:hypothetical protein
MENFGVFMKTKISKDKIGCIWCDKTASKWYLCIECRRGADKAKEELLRKIDNGEDFDD